jgi:hypothetical protein
LKKQKPLFQAAFNAGIGSWGGKIGAELRFFYSGCAHHGGALAVGFVHSSGLDTSTIDIVSTTGANTTATLRLLPQNNLHFSWYKSFRLSRGSKFFLQAGYSLPLSTDIYQVIRGPALSQESRIFIDILRPGGVIISGGFSFAFGD